MAQYNGPRLRRNREPKRFMSTDLLKVIGFLLTVEGTVGVAFLKNGILHMNGMTQMDIWNNILNDAMSSSLLAWAVICDGMAALAWPIFAYLAVEGFQNTSSEPKYILRLFITAIVSEVPYDLAMSGTWLDLSSQNFLFSLAIGVAMLYVVQECGRNRENVTGLRIAFLGGAILWTFLLQSQLGVLVVSAMAAMYYFRERELWRNLIVVALGLVTPPASLSVLLIHWYNGKPSMFPKWLCYGVYPVHLLVIGLACKFLL